MSRTEEHKQGLLRATFNLWLNWAYPFVALSAAFMLAPYTSKRLFPMVMYALGVIIFIIIRQARNQDNTSCKKIPYVMSLILFWTATLLVIFNLLSFIHAQTALNGQPYNPDIPWLPVLVTSPIGFAVCRYFLTVRQCAICDDCEARNGRSVERGYLASLFKKESVFQLQCMFYIFLGLTIVSWGYYFTLYKNVNLNPSDMYFYTYVPVSVFTLSLIYMGFRYHGYYIYYLTSDGRQDDLTESHTTVRFLVIAEDTLWLKVPEITGVEFEGEVTPIDTPVISTMSFRENFNHIEAAGLFRDKTGIMGADVRYLYRSADKYAGSNVFHFAAYLNSKEDTGCSLITGEWFNFSKIQLLHQARLLSNVLEAELHRIHTTVMAWKTYTRKGKRLYEIKNYQPTFRLSDMKKWDVDYDDPIWMFIAMNNEDKRFFRLRKLWRRIITGTGI